MFVIFRRQKALIRYDSYSKIINLYAIKKQKKTFFKYTITIQFVYNYAYTSKNNPSCFPNEKESINGFLFF